MHRFRKAVQQQHQRRTGFAGHEGVEGEIRSNADFLEMGHRITTHILFGYCDKEAMLPLA
jgi:hypothetical protein